MAFEIHFWGKLWCQRSLNGALKASRWLSYAPRGQQMLTQRPHRIIQMPSWCRLRDSHGPEMVPTVLSKVSWTPFWMFLEIVLAILVMFFMMFVWVSRSGLPNETWDSSGSNRVAHNIMVSISSRYNVEASIRKQYHWYCMCVLTN